MSVEDSSPRLVVGRRGGWWVVGDVVGVQHARGLGLLQMNSQVGEGMQTGEWRVWMEARGAVGGMYGSSKDGVEGRGGELAVFPFRSIRRRLVASSGFYTYLPLRRRLRRMDSHRFFCMNLDPPPLRAPDSPSMPIADDLLQQHLREKLVPCRSMGGRVNGDLRVPGRAARMRREVVVVVVGCGHVHGTSFRGTRRTEAGAVECGGKGWQRKGWRRRAVGMKVAVVVAAAAASGRVTRIGAGDEGGRVEEDEEDKGMGEWYGGEDGDGDGATGGDEDGGVTGD
ncbi:hypothetical protein R3P38DRAFT_3219006 [Favolaschia claudopus]|uniref:Uncharacterized protein n=1 Tax=Favolaschia claudopus TaxID=2862362 RepID=A0AAW0A335_9AGAR